MLSAPVQASSGVKLECREPAEELSVTALPAPPMAVNAIEQNPASVTASDEDCIETPVPPTATQSHKLSPTAATIRRIFGDDDETLILAPEFSNAIIVTSPAMADAKRSSETAEKDSTNRIDDSGAQRNEAPGATTDSPAEAESDQARFRRQMYRIDI